MLIPGPGGRMPLHRALFAAVLMTPISAGAQMADSLKLGDRVRVTIAASRGNTNVFIGALDRLSPDTLVVAIPGGKGSVVLSRSAISEVSKSAGHESRWSLVPPVAFLALPVLTLASLPERHIGHWAALRNQRYGLIAFS